MARHNWHRDFERLRFVCGPRKDMVVARFGDYCRGCGAIVQMDHTPGDTIQRVNFGLSEGGKSILDRRWAKNDYAALVGLIHEAGQ